MFSCLQILEAFLWFVLITLLNVTLIILTLSVSRLLNLLLRLVAFLLFLNARCLASTSRWITASSSWKRFCLFVCRALCCILVMCMVTGIRPSLPFVMRMARSRTSRTWRRRRRAPDSRSRGRCARERKSVGLGQSVVLSGTLIILTLSVSRLLNLLLRLVAFLLFLNPQCLASISSWIDAPSWWRIGRASCRERG